MMTENNNENGDSVKNKGTENPHENSDLNDDKVEQKNKGPEEVVFVYDNGSVKMVKVSTGISDDNYLEIKDGLKSGEQVVSGSYRAISRELQDGSKVRVEEKRGRTGNGAQQNN
jgi:HlyD family secretion protein